MDKITHQVRAEHWARILNECLNSGMSKTAWCRANGISEKQFFYWQRILRREAYGASQDPSLPYEATISMPEMARLLGISRKDVYALLKSKRYGKYFSTVIIADQKRITKDSFQKFLDEQEEYQLSPCNDYKELAMEENVALANFRRKKLLQSGNRRCNGNLNYLTPEEAALMAKVSRSTIVNWYQREEFPIIHIGRRPYFLIIPCIYAFTNSCCRLSIEFQSFSSSS